MNVSIVCFIQPLTVKLQQTYTQSSVRSSSSSCCLAYKKREGSVTGRFHARLMHEIGCQVN